MKTQKQMMVQHTKLAIELCAKTWLVIVKMVDKHLFGETKFLKLLMY